MSSRLDFAVSQKNNRGSGACSAFLGFRFREKIFLRIFQPVGYFKGARLFLRILRNGICLSGFGIYIDPPEKFFEGYTVVFAKNG